MTSITPLSAWTMRSIASRSLLGPSSPKGGSTFVMSAPRYESISELYAPL
ncbi:hypothetical protein [Halalkalicoccus subterraneus]|nr:hypothetical protein [Halalkalicoccus subterraneus]